LNSRIKLREARPDELLSFQQMDQDRDTRDHITRYTLAEHEREFARTDIVYLSICRDSRLVGYFILALGADPASVEFRRIVVSCRGIGIGQAAIPAMEVYCREQLHCRRIWLDVFDSNPRGRHIYQKLGYRLFDTGELEGRKLLYMDKSLSDPAGKPR